MKPILTIQYADGHPLWQEDEHKLQLGEEWLNVPQLMSDNGAFYRDGDGVKHRLYNRTYTPLNDYKISVHDDGIYAHPHSSSSGGGRRSCGDPVKILDRSAYSEIVWKGEPMGKFKSEPWEREMLGPGFVS